MPSSRKPLLPSSADSVSFGAKPDASPVPCRLKIDSRHALNRVTLTGSNSMRERRIQVLQLFRAQADIQGADILFKISQASCAGNGNDVVALRKHPSQSELGGGAA